MLQLGTVWKPHWGARGYRLHFVDKHQLIHFVHQARESVGDGVRVLPSQELTTNRADGISFGVFPRCKGSSTFSLGEAYINQEQIFLAGFGGGCCLSSSSFRKSNCGIQQHCIIEYSPLQYSPRHIIDQLKDGTVH